MPDLARLFSIEGRTALVTGASSGLGRYFAGVLHDAGTRVVLAARRLDRIEAEAARLGQRAVAVAMDVAEESPSWSRSAAGWRALDQQPVTTEASLAPDAAGARSVAGGTRPRRGARENPTLHTG